MPPINVNSPDSGTRYYIQKLIKRAKAFRKRKAKHARPFLKGKAPRQPDGEREYHPEP